MLVSTKRLIGLVAVLLIVCLFTLNMSIQSAHAASSQHDPTFHSPTSHLAPVSRQVTIPYTSGGGCHVVFSLIRLSSCISENGSKTIVPDAYLTPWTSNHQLFSACVIYVELIDDTAGHEYWSNGQNCLNVLQGNGWTAQYYGTSAGAIGGHAYHTYTEVDYSYNGGNYYNTSDSPEQYA